MSCTTDLEFNQGKQLVRLHTRRGKMRSENGRGSPLSFKRDTCKPTRLLQPFAHVDGYPSAHMDLGTAKEANEVYLRTGGGECSGCKRPMPHFVEGQDRGTVVAFFCANKRCRKPGTSAYLVVT